MVRSQSARRGSFSSVAFIRERVTIRLGAMFSAQSRAIAASLAAVASRVRSRLPAQRASLSSPGPSMEMPTWTL